MYCHFLCGVLVPLDITAVLSRSCHGLCIAIKVATRSCHHLNRFAPTTVSCVCLCVNRTQVVTRAYLGGGGVTKKTRVCF